MAQHVAHPLVVEEVIGSNLGFKPSQPRTLKMFSSAALSGACYLKSRVNALAPNRSNSFPCIVRAIKELVN